MQPSAFPYNTFQVNSLEGVQVLPIQSQAVAPAKSDHAAYLSTISNSACASRRAEGELSDQEDDSVVMNMTFRAGILGPVIHVRHNDEEVSVWKNLATHFDFRPSVIKSLLSHCCRLFFQIVSKFSYPLQPITNRLIVRLEKVYYRVLIIWLKFRYSLSHQETQVLIEPALKMLENIKHVSVLNELASVLRWYRQYNVNNYAFKLARIGRKNSRKDVLNSFIAAKLATAHTNRLQSRMNRIRNVVTSFKFSHEGSGVELLEQTQLWHFNHDLIAHQILQKAGFHSPSYIYVLDKLVSGVHHMKKNQEQMEMSVEYTEFISDTFGTLFSKRRVHKLMEVEHISQLPLESIPCQLPEHSFAAAYKKIARVSPRKTARISPTLLNRLVSSTQNRLKRLLSVVKPIQNYMEGGLQRVYKSIYCYLLLPSHLRMEAFEAWIVLKPFFETYPQLESYQLLFKVAQEIQRINTLADRFAREINTNFSFADARKLIIAQFIARWIDEKIVDHEKCVLNKYGAFGKVLQHWNFASSEQKLKNIDVRTLLFFQSNHSELNEYEKAKQTYQILLQKYDEKKIWVEDWVNEIFNTSYATARIESLNRSKGAIQLSISPPPFVPLAANSDEILNPYPSSAELGNADSGPADQQSQGLASDLKVNMADETTIGSAPTLRSDNRDTRATFRRDRYTLFPLSFSQSINRSGLDYKQQQPYAAVLELITNPPIAFEDGDIWKDIDHSQANMPKYPPIAVIPKRRLSGASDCSCP